MAWLVLSGAFDIAGTSRQGSRGDYSSGRRKLLEFLGLRKTIRTD
jgi:hypothetical protein